MRAVPEEKVGNKKWLNTILSVLKVGKLLVPELTFGSAGVTEPAARIPAQQDLQPCRGFASLVGCFFGWLFCWGFFSAMLGASSENILVILKDRIG